MPIVYESTPTESGLPPFEQILRLYSTAYLDKIQPERERIKALIDQADAEGHQSVDIPLGDHGRNRVVGICGGGEYYIEHFRYVHELLGLDVRYADIAQPWDFPDESFDFVFSAQTVTLPSLILKAEKIVKTMLRVCRSPGRVVVVPHPHLKWDK
jgi:SAM-dependent methyltransferase